MKSGVMGRIRIRAVAAVLLSVILWVFWISGNALARSFPELEAELAKVVQLRQEYENYYDDLKNNRIVVMPTKDKPSRYVALDAALLYEEIERLVKERGKADPSVIDKKTFILTSARAASLWIFDQVVKAQANDLRNFMQFADSQAQELEKEEADLRRRLAEVRAGRPDPGPGARRPSLPDTLPPPTTLLKNLRDQLSAEWAAQKRKWFEASYHTGVAIAHLDLAVTYLPLPHEGLPKFEERIAQVRQAIAECNQCIVAKNNERLQLDVDYNQLRASKMDETRKRSLMAENRAKYAEAANYIIDLTGTVAACKLRSQKIIPVSQTCRVPQECIKR